MSNSPKRKRPTSPKEIKEQFTIETENYADQLKFVLDFYKEDFNENAPLVIVKPGDGPMGTGRNSRSAVSCTQRSRLLFYIKNKHNFQHILNAR